MEKTIRFFGRYREKPLEFIIQPTWNLTELKINLEMAICTRRRSKLHMTNESGGLESIILYAKKKDFPDPYLSRKTLETVTNLKQVCPETELYVSIQPSVQLRLYKQKTLKSFIDESRKENIGNVNTLKRCSNILQQKNREEILSLKYKVLQLEGEIVKEKIRSRNVVCFMMQNYEKLETKYYSNKKDSSICQEDVLFASDDLLQQQSKKLKREFVFNDCNLLKLQEKSETKYHNSNSIQREGEKEKIQDQEAAHVFSYNQDNKENIPQSPEQKPPKEADQNFKGTSTAIKDTLNNIFCNIYKDSTKSVLTNPRVTDSCPNFPETLINLRKPFTIIRKNSDVRA